MIEIDFATTAPDIATLAIPIGKDAMAGTVLPGVNDQDVMLIRRAAMASRFDGEAGAMFEQFVGAGDLARRVVLCGIGATSAEDFERAGAALVARLLASGETHVAFDLSGLAIAPSIDCVMRLASAITLRSWRFDQYRTKLPEKQKPTLVRVTIVAANGNSAASWQRSRAVAEGVAFTRSLVTEPANVIYPESFVERCQMLKSHGVEVEAMGPSELTALGMGALLGVSQGSEREPRVLVMRWDGSNGRGEPPVALVGKGVTFDTGGISIKPAAGMEDMKWDMGGAGAVAGTMLALAARKSTAHVIGICGLVENMPDGKAQRPGDVVTTMSGQTVEVINTDAEGRLVLCDVMTWVQKKYSPRVMVDLATLTGAIIVALGNEYGGLYSNDDELAERLTSAGKAVGDPLWRMPLLPAYDKMIDSPIADVKNVGPREAGSVTAAQFLQRFVNDGVKWAHLDIAGMVWANKAGGVWDKGATGYGVRLLDRFVADNFEG